MLKHLISKKIFLWLLVSAVMALLIIFASDYLIKHQTEELVFDDVTTIPYRKVGVVLGTSKKIKGKYINLYFKYRIEATVALFKAKKIDYIVVSGDNSRKEYNEAEDMQQALIAKGIPNTRIFLDYAGFRTLDSVVRMKEIFGQSSFTIISQKFHNQRAIYVAYLQDIDAIGFNAKDVKLYYGIKTQVREKLARVKVFIDYIVGKEPKFLGNPIDMP